MQHEKMQSQSPIKLESSHAVANTAAAGYPQPLSINWVATTDSPEFTYLCWSLNHSSIVALDAEWKPMHNYQHDPQQLPPGFPNVSLLQIACRLAEIPPQDLVSAVRVPSYGDDESPVFLVDLLSVPLASIHAVLSEMFLDPNILKLGFRFKQDLIYLSSTFCSQGCEPGFDKVTPFLDISGAYHLMQPKQSSRRESKDAKSLATVCSELLGIHISKELQCSDWSLRPLSDEQKTYAAIDAHSLLEIFNVFQAKVDIEGSSSCNLAKQLSSDSSLGLNKSFDIQESTSSDNILSNKFCDASDMIKFGTPFENIIASSLVSKRSCPIDQSLRRIIKKYSTKISLKESDRLPRTSRKKVKKHTNLGVKAKVKSPEVFQEWQGPPPWDFSVGGDNSPKFLCDVMVEGLAKHLRCVGIDAAVPSSKKPESRELIEQANREKRVLLTRDAKLLRYEYLIKNQIYRVKANLKNDQLLEIIETFQLRISEDQLMSRCTKCNGRFVQRPLSMEEAVEAAKGFQKIPDCLFDKNLEFWQCTDCNQLYWEGTQYHNAVQKFVDVCNL